MEEYVCTVLHSYNFLECALTRIFCEAKLSQTRKNWARLFNRIFAHNIAED